MPETQKSSPAPVVLGGHLGWSNVRSGVEIFARQQDGGSGRWGSRARYTPGDMGGPNWGDILTDHLETAGAGEGQAVVVVVLPGRTLDVPPETLERIRTAVATILSEEPSDV